MTPAIIKRIGMTELMNALALVLKQPGGLFVGGFLIGAGSVWRFIVIPLRASAELAIEKYNTRVEEDAAYWKSIVIEQAKK